MPEVVLRPKGEKKLPCCFVQGRGDKDRKQKVSLLWNCFPFFRSCGQLDKKKA